MTPLLSDPLPGPRADLSAGPATLACTEREALARTPRELLIGGAWRAAGSGDWLAVEDPATEETLVRVADASPSDCLEAFDAAVAAQSGWAARAPRERSRVLRRAAAAVRADEERLAIVCTLETGKPVAESRAEVEFAADYLEWYADEAVRISGRRQIAPDGASQHVVLREPIGPCLAITPWNFPLAIPARTISPAVAAGCTLVLRAPAAAPLSALALGQLLLEAGLPSGVLNVVVSSTDDATDALLADPRLRKLSFTGSGRIGRHLRAEASQGPARTSMELGGCAPFVVFADADLDGAIAGALLAKMRNGGAACTAANRFYVERPIAAEFTRRLAERLSRAVLGRGTDPAVTLGPMISAGHVARLRGLVEDALASGARLELAGGPRPGPGHFFAPAVLSDVPEWARVMQEETFGPVAPIAVFDSEDEVVERCNARAQGLAAYVYTSDLGRAMRLATRIEAGMIGLNRGRVSSAAAPFAGVKGSGDGVSGGCEGIERYLVTRCVTMPLDGLGAPAPAAHEGQRPDGRSDVR